MSAYPHRAYPHRPHPHRAYPLALRSPAAGYSLVEIIVVLVLFSIVMVSIGAVLLDQRRFYAAHTQIVDTRDAVRIAAEVLSGELREVSPLEGDLYAIAADSIAFRSLLGFGVVCSVEGGWIRLWATTGVFGSAERDSALLFAEGDPATPADDGWNAFGIAEVRSPGEAQCPNGQPAELELRLLGDASAASGVPVRAFRPYVYRLYRSADSNWWLGQRLRDGGVQPVAGPFDAPAAGGLAFQYLDRLGSPVSDPTDVTQVRIRIRGRSIRPIQVLDGTEFHSDTLSTVVYLRNSTRAPWVVEEEAL